MSLQYRNPKHWRSPKNQVLNGAFPNWDEGEGIFSILAEAQTPPAWAETVSPLGLDIAYHGQRSGDKFIAPMLYYWLDEDTAEITESGKTKVVMALTARYAQKWAHLWSLYTSQYSPLDTYTIEETRTLEHEGTANSTDERTPNLTTRDVIDEETKDDADNTKTTTFGKTNTQADTNSSTNTHGVEGFNSDAFNDSDRDVTSGTSSKTSTDGGTETEREQRDESSTRDADNTSTLSGTDTHEREEVDAYTDTETKSRSGNLYHAPAELMSVDREFWLDDFFQIVFSDIDKMLTLAIYSESSVNYTIF